MNAQQDRFDREVLRSMSASISSGLAFSFNPQDMSDLLFRMSERIDPKPRADLTTHDPLTTALVEAVKNALTGYDQWANCVSGTPEGTIASGALFARVNRLRAALADWEATRPT